MDYVNIPSHLKVERKKNEFITEAKKRLSGINIKENLLEVLIVLMNMAEEYFASKKHRKYGKEKKDCVMAIVKDLTSNGFDDSTLSRMIETLVNTKNIKKLGAAKKIYMWVKKKLFPN